METQPSTSNFHPDTERRKKCAQASVVWLRTDTPAPCATESSLQGPDRHEVRDDIVGGLLGSQPPPLNEATEI